MAVQLPVGDGEVVAHLGAASAKVRRDGEAVTVTFNRDGRDHLVVSYTVGDPNLVVELARLSPGPPPVPPAPGQRRRRRR